VIAGAVERDAGLAQPPQGVTERGTIGISNREMIEAGRAGRRRVAVAAFPGVQADVVVIAAGAENAAESPIR
jgi:hypothetical protein